MGTPVEVEIWPKETGIRDLPSDWQPLSVPEMRRVQSLWRERRERALDSAELRAFTDQLSREWAIETGVIENLYDIDRGVTMALIEQGFSAAVIEPGSVDKEPNYVLVLLHDQQNALEGLFDFVASRRPLSTGYVKELHAAMTRSQGSVKALDAAGNVVDAPMLHGEYKQLPNYPRRGDKVFLYCPPEHTAAEMDRLVEMHLRHDEQGVAPEVQAAWLHHRFTQIHPFQDGNGRVARALASLVLIRAGLFPLVVPRDEKSVYIDVLERADAGELRPLVVLIARRQETAFRRAGVLLARLAPDSASPEEAIAKLAEAVANSDEARTARYSSRVNALGTTLLNTLNQRFVAAKDALAAVFPGADIRASSLGTPTTLETLSDMILVLRNVRLSQPIWSVEYGCNFHADAHLVLVAYAAGQGLDEAVHATAALGFGDTWELLGDEDFSWYVSEDQSSALTRAAVWARDLVAPTLDRIRKAM
jgi:hypothetical protein